MNLKRLLHRIRSPCAKCPYTLGHIKAVDNPCPHCKVNGYKTFDMFNEYLRREQSGKKYP